MYLAGRQCAFDSRHGTRSPFAAGKRASGLARVAIDVTDRGRPELAAAESIARFRRLADALPEKIFTATPDGETDYLNQQWVTYTGLRCRRCCVSASW